MATDWSREEVVSTVVDYFAMLASELSGVPYSKAVHRRALIERLSGRSEQSIEFKHANISAALIDLGFPYICGYKPRFNYQHLLYDVVSERLVSDGQLLNVATADVERPIDVPEVEDILRVITTPPVMQHLGEKPNRGYRPKMGANTAVNFLEREARNRSLGAAGELFVMNFERARLINLGKERLAQRIEHTSQTQGDGAGYDILSFEASGADRLIEVKTTKYGRETPFFVSRNELAVSETEATRYHLYRLFRFNVKPRLFTLSGAFSEICSLSPLNYLASII
jgi:hypothetical protein